MSYSERSLRNLDVAIASLFEKYENLDKNEYAQFDEFKIALEEVLHRYPTNSLKSWTGAESACISLLSKNLNLSIARYLAGSYGVQYDRPYQMYEFLNQRYMFDLPAASNETDPVSISIWKLQTDRIFDIMSWFVEDFGLSPNDSLIEDEQMSAEYWNLRIKPTVFTYILLAMGASNYGTKFLTQTLIYYGGDIYQVMEVPTFEGGPLQEQSVLEYICRDVMEGPDAPWMITIDGWIVIALSIFTLNSSASEVLGPEDVEAIKNIKLPNGTTIGYEAYQFRSFINMVYLVIISCHAGLSYSQMKLLGDLGILTIAPNDSISKRRISINALQYGALDAYRYLVNFQNIPIPNDALTIVRPDLVITFLNQLGLFGVSRSRAAEMYSKFQRR